MNVRCYVASNEMLKRDKPIYNIYVVQNFSFNLIDINIFFYFHLFDKFVGKTETLQILQISYYS